ncbi:MAG: asparagine--tRNA ligase [Deltaproteobacteria bacterium]|jgi:asparaginyl-tRNA synthetase|nr:asparagine--tRNA ligase [Deltaproteobacteria bacterium]
MLKNDIRQIATVLASESATGKTTVGGWIRTRRDAKGFTFLEINDGSCLKNLQVVVTEGTPAFAAMGEANNGAAVMIGGQLVESPGQGQKWELKAETLTVFGFADQENYPLQKKRHTDEFLRGIAHLRARTNKYGAMLRIRAEAAQAAHNYLRSEGFRYVHAPILTGSDAEGAGEMFRVTTLPLGYQPPNPANPYDEDFFGRESNLTVSGQLEAEALALGLGRVYTFGPTFRAENSNTARHAAEFWMIEPEAAFYDLEDNMELAENLTRAVAWYVLENCQEDLDLFNRFVDAGLMDRLKQLAMGGYDRISYREAVKILQQSGRRFEHPVDFGTDLSTEHERFLAEEHFKGPVTVYNYPKAIKAFYMRDNDDGTVAAMDLLVPRIGELIGGSQREERLDRLEGRIADMGQNIDNYWWYLDLRRYGTVPHSGFGLGFERLIMLITGISNIRDVLPFPRTPRSLEF